MSYSTYENAAKDIEQEKKMVAALKRLSIGNLMNYDPDLPPSDEFEFQYQYDDNLNNEIQKEATLSRGKSLKRQPTKKSSMSKEVNMNNGDSDSVPPLPSISISESPNSSGRSTPTYPTTPPEQEDRDEYPVPTTPSRGVDISVEEEEEDQENGEAEILQNSLEVNPLLWVPASLHPEVDPEQFKMHLKTTVEDLLEKKLSRNPSKRSSLSLSSSNGDLPIIQDDDEPSGTKDVADSKASSPSASSSNETLEPSVSYQERRFSNPSLRDLTNELEQLSKLAGMDSNDAVTLARTLSKSSLGYTDVERQAFDEMTSPPKKNDLSQQQHQLLQSYRERDSEKFQSSGRESRRMNLADYQKKLYQQQQYKNHQRQLKYEQAQAQAYQQSQLSRRHHHQGSSSSQQQQQQRQEDFALKRSRRLDYRKAVSNVAASGSNLQQTKAHKLNELRSNLNTSLTPEIPQQLAQTHKRSQNSKTKSYSQSNNRSSQVLFSYRNPNVPNVSNLANSPQISRDSPYPSGQVPIQNQMHTSKYAHSATRRVSPQSGQHRVSSGEQAYLQQQQQQGATTYSGAAAIPYIKEKVRQRQVSPNSQYLPQQHSQSIHQTSQRHSKLPHTSHKLPSKSSSPYVQQGLQNQMIPNQGHIQQKHSQSRSLHHRSHYGEGQQPLPQQQSYLPVQSQGQLTKGQGHPHQQQGIQKKFHQGYSPISHTTGAASKVNNKSRELNQNLDLLRSEINEFKESLSKSEGQSAPTNIAPKVQKAPTEQIPAALPDTITQEPDFSFDTTYQDISYEDSLGIEKEVLKELDIESNYESEKTSSLQSQSRKHSISRKLSNASSKEHENQSRPKFSPTVDTSTPNIDERNDISGDYFNSEVISRHEENYDIQQEQEPEPEPEPDLVADAEIKQDFGKDETAGTELEPETARVTESEQGAENGTYLIDENEASGSSRSPNTSPRKKKTFGILSANTTELPTNSAQGSLNSKSLKKKKSWSLFKERAVSTSAIETTNVEAEESQPISASNSTKASNRSISNPETSDNRKISEESNQRKSSENANNNHLGKDAVGKENMITKLFKKKRTNSSSTNVTPVTSTIIEEEANPIRGSGVTVDYESDSESVNGKKDNKKKTGGLFKKKSKKEKQVPLSISNNSISSFISSKSKEDEEDKSSTKSSGKKLMDKIRNKSEEKIDEDETAMQDGADREENDGEGRNNASGATTAVTAASGAAGSGADERQLQTTLEVQEKLKKSIKRSSRANQPLEFTDSAFGFPLPPPSQSTLVMLDYRFPVHVERAIYRLSHLKLANPKRSLREQVLLSNFMYAYLNLVDHTLHLEQQLSSSEAGSLAGDDAGGAGEDDDGVLHESKEYNNINDNDEMTTDAEHALYAKDEPMIEDDDFETEETLTIDLNVANYDHMSQIEV